MPAMQDALPCGVFLLFHFSCDNPTEKEPFLQKGKELEGKEGEKKEKKTIGE